MIVALEVEVPIACFRQSQAREYFETYPVPPPSTVYGMLLSLVGEMDRYKHCGVRLAIALLSEPKKSTIVRTFHRYKKRDIHDPTNIRPDYQELLTDVQFIVWVKAETETARPSLAKRLQQAFANPASVRRFGGLSLGESRDLINAVSLFRGFRRETVRWLVQDENGLLTLPYWVDHIGSKGTCWLRYELQQYDLQEPPDRAWTEIQAV
ncbi:MAG: type I-MYXAN CRISPR-associated protein Cas5/Cmx5/DevS [Lyngbya sp. HA4199-MV5]|jgi:CRISPR-associated protein Cas5t|nr:type I-MYXAN CRISPR-associated protein Cas5/Cmx5/DevS [Lyngbya sp. HA4199-MV5]